MTPSEIHVRALDGFGTRVHQVRTDQWDAATPCTEWDVRDLVGHLVWEQLWVPPLLDGATVAEVGGRFEGDVLGEDPSQSWDRAAAGAREAFAALDGPGGLDRTVHLSYGDTSAEHYLYEMISDLVVHAWDLARAIGADERLDPELVALVWDRTESRADQLASSGLFDPPVPTPPDADLQTRMLAVFGRRA